MPRKLLFGFCLVLSLAFAAEKFSLLYELPGECDFFTTDNLGNSYRVKNDLLEKYDPAGHLLKSYSNKSLGRITSVDASNPMKVLLYYRNFSSVVFLDNFLSQVGDPVNLQDLGFSNVPLVCTAAKGGLWLLNPQLPELLRLDGSLQKQESSGNITEAAGDHTPLVLAEYGNQLFLYCDKKGIMVFDQYGTYRRTIAVQGIMNFQVRDENLAFIRHKHLVSFNLATLAEDSFPLPDSSAVLHRTEKDRLTLQCPGRLKIYRVK
jgi:hypothetical protein